MAIVVIDERLTQISAPKLNPARFTCLSLSLLARAWRERRKWKAEAASDDDDDDDDLKLMMMMIFGSIYSGPPSPPTITNITGSTATWTSDR